MYVYASITSPLVYETIEILTNYDSFAGQFLTKHCKHKYLSVKFLYRHMCLFCTELYHILFLQTTDC